MSDEFFTGSLESMCKCGHIMGRHDMEHSANCNYPECKCYRFEVVYENDKSYQFRQQAEEVFALDRTHFVGHSGKHLLQRFRIERLVSYKPEVFHRSCVTLADQIEERVIYGKLPLAKNRRHERIVGIQNGGATLAHGIFPHLRVKPHEANLRFGTFDHGKLDFTPCENEMIILVDDVFSTGSQVAEALLSLPNVGLITTLLRWNTGVDVVPHFPKLSLYELKQTAFDAETCPICNPPQE